MLVARDKIVKRGYEKAVQTGQGRIDPEPKK